MQTGFEGGEAMMVSELLDRGEVRTRLKRGQQYELTRIEGLFGTEYP